MINCASAMPAGGGGGTIFLKYPFRLSLDQENNDHCPHRFYRQWLIIVIKTEVCFVIYLLSWLFFFFRASVYVHVV